VRAISHPAVWTVFLAAIIGFPLVRNALVPPRPLPPVLGTIPAFEFVDQNGVPFSAGTLAGKPWVADFVFTRCPTVCPRMTEQLAALQSRLGQNVHLVSFSVDPTFDTPARLRAFAAAHGANSPRWHFLTGESTSVQKAVTEGFKISLSHEGPEEDFLSIVHGVHAVLVDGQGRIRGYYDTTDPSALERLVHDAAHLGG
jgi:protein SCO1